MEKLWGHWLSFIEYHIKDGCEKNYVIPDGTIIFVTNIPWYKSWFGFRPTRILLGDGVTTFKKLKFI